MGGRTHDPNSLAAQDLFICQGSENVPSSTALNP